MANFQGKVSDELYDRLEELKKEAGGTHAEFLERMANAYELHKIKQGDNLLASEVEELEGLTARINRLMINANEKINSSLRDKDLVYEEKQSTNQELIARLRDDLSKLKENNVEIKKELEEANTSNTELIQKLKEVEEQLSTMKDLSAEYKEKNEKLSSIIAETEKDREENKQLREELSSIKESLLEAQNKANSEGQKVAELTKEKEKMEQEFNDKISAIETAHNQSITHIEALKELEVKQARTDEKEQAQQKIEVHMNRENELREKIDNIKEDKEKALLELKEIHEEEQSNLQKQIEFLTKELSELKAALQTKKAKTRSKAKDVEEE